MAYPPSTLPTNAVDGASPDDTTPEALLVAAEVNATNAAINDVVSELGANPSGAAADVGARLTAIEGAAAALPGTYVPRRGTPTVVCLGDSLTGGSTTPGVNYPTLLSAVSGRAFSIVNKGVGGNTTTQMLARVQADVIDLAPSVCVFLGGTNDFGAISMATTQANIAAIASAVTAAGIDFVICTTPPRNQHTGATGASSVRDLNMWIKMWGAANGYRVVDLHRWLVNPRTGEYAAGMNADTVHPSYAAIMLMAEQVAAALTADASRPAFVPPLAPFEGEVDFFSSMPATVAYSSQLVYNPLMYDLDTNGQPDYWSETAAAGVTRSVVQDPRFAGYALRLAAVSQDSAYRQTFQVPAGTYAVGDRLRFIHRLAVDSPSSIPDGSGIELHLQFLSVSNVKTVTQWKYATPTGQALEFAVDAIVPAGTSGVRAEIDLNCGGGSGTFLIGQVGIINLTALGLASTALTA